LVVLGILLVKQGPSDENRKEVGPA